MLLIVEKSKNTMLLEKRIVQKREEKREKQKLKS